MILICITYTLQMLFAHVELHPKINVSKAVVDEFLGAELVFL